MSEFLERRVFERTGHDEDTRKEVPFSRKRKRR